MRLKDKVALITGSSRGIGRATALLFAREGAKVIVNYSKSRKEANAVVNEIRGPGSDAIAVKCNISDEKEVKEMMAESISRFGRIDILVNNAGIVASKPFSELTPADWERTLGVNLIGVFLCSQAAAPHMLGQKQGRIINISSIRGIEHCGRPGAFDYSASKAGVINFTKTLAKELAPFVTVNSVAPGWVETEMSRNLDPALRKSETEKIYMKRFASPDEVAKAALFLASDDASYITGHVLVVDGGYSLK